MTDLFESRGASPMLIARQEEAFDDPNILDGEIVVLKNGVPDFYALQKRTLLTERFKIEMESVRFPASFVAFDCIYADGKE